jgi:acyl dehydratase
VKATTRRGRLPDKSLIPRGALFFDDLFVGQEFATAGLTITEDAIIRFSIEWDFQPFHVDRVVAADSVYESLVASALHTLAITMRLCVQAGLFTGTVVAGFEWGSIRLLRPVRPGDTLRAVVTVRSMRRSSSRPGLGIVKWRVRTLNQMDEVVLKTSATNLIVARRP